MRVASRAGERANVYQTGNSEFSQQTREFIERPVPVTDRI
jgi:hypothetical protein